MCSLCDINNSQRDPDGRYKVYLTLFQPKDSTKGQGGVILLQCSPSEIKLKANQDVSYDWDGILVCIVLHTVRYCIYCRCVDQYAVCSMLQFRIKMFQNFIKKDVQTYV